MKLLWIKYTLKNKIIKIKIIIKINQYIYNKSFNKVFIV